MALEFGTRVFAGLWGEAKLDFLMKGVSCIFLL